MAQAAIFSPQAAACRSASRSISAPISSAISAPRNITSTRSHSADQLVELGRHQQHAHSRRRDLVDDGADLGLGADIDADRRLVHDEDPRVRLQPFGEQHLLLVAARQLARPAPAARAPAPSAWPCCGPRCLPWRADRAGRDRARSGTGSAGRCSRSGEVRQDALAEAVAGDQRDAGGKRRGRLVRRTICPATRTTPASRRDSAAPNRALASSPSPAPASPVMPSTSPGFSAKLIVVQAALDGELLDAQDRALPRRPRRRGARAASRPAAGRPWR